MTMANNPGPGSYKTQYDQVLSKSPYYKIGTAKRSMALGMLTQTPAPTAYLPKINFIKKHVANWSINSPSKNQASPESKTPGPGAYDTKIDSSS